MRHDRALALPLLLGLVLGCAPEPPSAPARARPEVSIAPLVEGEAAPIVRLRVRAEPPVRPEDVGLFSGRLSDYHLGRLARRELSETLRERLVPSLRFADAASGDVVVAPEIALSPGETYTLITPEWGRLVEFRVTSAGRPWLERVWPPRGEPGAGYALFCGADAPRESVAVELEAAAGVAEVSVVSRETDARACVAARFDALALEGRRVLFPAEVAGFALEPTPLEIAPRRELAPASCLAGERSLGPGCARVEDDRVIVSGPGAPLLWIFAGAGRTEVLPVEAGARAVVRGLSPAARQRLAGVAITTDGAEHAFDLEVQTAPPRPRLVLNEVLANPLGSEPRGEWIELVNDGTLAGDLAGVELEDSGGAVVLPGALVSPGEHVLIARLDFASGLSDVAPALTTRVIGVPALGKNGLANGGEALFLWAPDGELLSRFPALPAGQAGVSAARSRPDALDDDASAFAAHVAPGASPGAPNPPATPPGSSP